VYMFMDLGHSGSMFISRLLCSYDLHQIHSTQ
jgi:hypothetical protein